MDRLRTDEILADVREDHELVAEHLRILTELQGMIAGAEGRHVERAVALLRESSRFFQAKLLPHLDHEEQGMFLLLRERLPRGSTLIYELEAEHAQMRRLCERLDEELGWLRHQKHRRPEVLSDLQSLCAGITALLSQHAQREEALIERYSKSLSDERDEVATAEAPRASQEMGEAKGRQATFTIQ